MIKTIIFDFGDVFINLDKAATLRELQRLEIEGFYEELLGINQDFEVGGISSQEFINRFLGKYSHLKASDITNSWNSILVDFPRHRIDFLKDLAARNDYQLMLLSNTNDLHIDWVKENVEFFEEFKACFDAFYLSQEINLRKPNAEIFEFVLQRHHLEPQEVLFIDDTKENIAAAEALGIQTWNIDPATEDVTELFSIKKELF